MTRCKPGNLAVITYDVPSCADNIGRLVLVCGPAAIDLNGYLTWLIHPVTPEPYMISDWEGNFLRFMEFGEQDVEHPDAWMMPIHPGDDHEDHDDQEDLPLERKEVTCR